MWLAEAHHLRSIYNHARDLYNQAWVPKNMMKKTALLVAG